MAALSSSPTDPSSRSAAGRARRLCPHRRLRTGNRAPSGSIDKERTHSMEKAPSRDRAACARAARGRVLPRLLVSLPLLAAVLTVATAGRLWCNAPPPGAGVARLGQLSRHEAAASGTDLCARLTLAPCAVLEVAPF